MKTLNDLAIGDFFRFKGRTTVYKLLSKNEKSAQTKRENYLLPSSFPLHRQVELIKHKPLIEILKSRF